MSLKKLLILLSKCLLLLTFLGIISCVSLFDNNFKNQVFIDHYYEQSGLIIRNKLLLYFPNTNKDTTLYTIKIDKNNFSQDLYLTTKEGFASKGSSIFSINWTLIDNKTGKTLFTDSFSLSDNYNIEKTEFTTLENEKRAKELLIAQAARNIRIKIYNFLHLLEQKNKKINPDN